LAHPHGFPVLQLLRASFGGPSCTNVVINVSAEDEHSEETLCSLRFGEKLAGVETSAVAMKAVDVHHMRVQVADELGAAQARLRELKRAGLGDHINTSAPPSEQTSLRRNMDTLQEREVELRQLRVRVVFPSFLSLSLSFYPYYYYFSHA
jgi:hypothetical protein